MTISANRKGRDGTKETVTVSRLRVGAVRQALADLAIASRGPQRTEVEREIRAIDSHVDRAENERISDKLRWIVVHGLKDRVDMLWAEMQRRNETAQPRPKRQVLADAETDRQKDRRIDSMLDHYPDDGPSRPVTI